MMTRTSRRRTVALVSAGLLSLSLTGCAGQPSEPDEGLAVDADGVAVTAGQHQPEEVNGVDLHFIAMMTPHHTQAVEMSEIILEADEASAPTRDLAERIKAGQQEEIDIMVGWADAWEQDERMAHHARHIANGMLTPEQMTQLRSLEADEADTLFLQLMHFHHEGAIAMTQDQIDSGGYQPLVDLAQQMVDIQTEEMEEMEQILNDRGDSLLND